MSTELSFEEASWLSVLEAVEAVGVESMLKTSWFERSWASTDTNDENVPEMAAAA